MIETNTAKDANWQDVISEFTNTPNNLYNNNWCPYRLPCGFCSRLGYDCPKQPYVITYDTKITCNTNKSEITC